MATTTPRLGDPPSTYEQTESILLQPSGAGALHVEVDNTSVSDDDDSSYGQSSASSATTSLSPSVFSYTYSNGRRYHSDRYTKAEYFLPNDETEQARLDLYHHMFMLILGGKLHVAPIGKNIQRILDVGTGTGIWAIDMAYDYPSAEVVGVDISPIQPSMVPSNCKFEVDDMEETWTYPKNHFGYIHMRSLSGSFTDWKMMVKQAYDHLQPGGYLEYQDYGCEVFFHTGEPCRGGTTPVAEYIDLLVKGANILKRPLLVAQSMKKHMEEAGFVDVVEQTAIWPIGDWPKDKQLKMLGRWGRIGLLESLEPFSLHLFTKGLGKTPGEVLAFCEKVRQDIAKGSKNKYYFHAWFIHGRKPYDKHGKETK